MSDLFFSVKTVNHTNIRAKALTLSSGYNVKLPDGSPMLAPLSYDPENFAKQVRESFQGLYGFRTNGPFDLQRTYNDTYEGGYNGLVRDFTPVASFAFGYTGAYEGYDVGTLLHGGGLVNRIVHMADDGSMNAIRNFFGVSKETSDTYGNNPLNVPNIIN